MFTNRKDEIVALVKKSGFISVKDLSIIFKVSEVTIRRDLRELHFEKRLKRKFGGAVSFEYLPLTNNELAQPTPVGSVYEEPLPDSVDILIDINGIISAGRVYRDEKEEPYATAVAQVNQTGKKVIISTDDYQGARDLGLWAARYTQKHFAGRAEILDLTADSATAQERSRGFLDGFRQILPGSQVAFSLRSDGSAFQLTSDALKVHHQINIIFAYNDTEALEAIKACRNLDISQDSVLILPFGLAGDHIKNALKKGEYVKAGVALFPEIVGLIYLEAAISIYNNRPPAENLITPWTIVAQSTLNHFYSQTGSKWNINWETVKEEFSLAKDLKTKLSKRTDSLPRRIGFVEVFPDQEWCRSLSACLSEYTEKRNIELKIIDQMESYNAEIDRKKREIARIAVEQIDSGDVILLSGGQISCYLAHALVDKENITVITNSALIFEILRKNPDIHLISTGGELRHPYNSLIGPIAEAALLELRADKLFIEPAGISIQFGFSHTNLAEVSIIQAMIRAAREVISLADHTRFEQRSVIKVAPLSVATRVITDRSLPAKSRLNFAKQGIEIILANA